MKTVPPHNHATIGDAGACPECRVYNIGLVDDAPHAFVLMFPDAHALSLVRDWGVDPLTTAWATGCNLPRCVITEEIPLGVAIESGIEMFRLYDDADADAALKVIERLSGGA
jgi:hypothetical protein